VCVCVFVCVCVCVFAGSAPCFARSARVCCLCMRVGVGVRCTCVLAHMCMRVCKRVYSRVCAYLLFRPCVSASVSCLVYAHNVSFADPRAAERPKRVSCECAQRHHPRRVHALMLRVCAQSLVEHVLAPGTARAECNGARRRRAPRRWWRWRGSRGAVGHRGSRGLRGGQVWRVSCCVSALWGARVPRRLPGGRRCGGGLVRDGGGGASPARTVGLRPR
jgi:hypothetical protein